MGPLQLRRSRAESHFDGILMQASTIAARLPDEARLGTTMSTQKRTRKKAARKTSAPEEALRHGAYPAGRASPPVPVLRQDPGGRLQGLHGVQPNVPPELLRRSRERILAPTQTRRPVGRRG